MKTTSNGGYHVTFKSILVFWDILAHDLKKSWNFCKVPKLCINRGTLHNFYVHFCDMGHSETWLKKELKFLFGIKTTSSERYYLSPLSPSETSLNMTWKRVEFSFWSKHYIKRSILRNFQFHFCLLRLSGRWLKKRWNFCLVWKLHQLGDIA